jgi:Tn3 transposase DDE domain
MLSAGRAKTVGPIGEVALGERRSRNVSGAVEAGVARQGQHFVRGVEADERRSGCSGAVLGHLESGAIGVIDKLGRQQERHGGRRAGVELGDLAQGGRVGVFGEVHGDVGLNRHESRHSVARLIFHGNEGQLRQPYRDGQEDQLGALGFALNALVLWSAQYLDDAIAQLRATVHQITDEDLRRLSPLQHENIKMLGHFPSLCPTSSSMGTAAS